ncbi:MAG: CocE/NonD family hydrolase [Acidobacteria bacterium]|nr:MAG: CocE/NonD family hydrolase [Acidobacteriota bacterium]REK03105.1 MAG: CocE/NonD family hydrolase [Acidobacteriota bacterium]REK15453.1 MAG: CocE/NonD family hydrolase [Acidobacteriota bacterium]REK45803.1 MAG: CocE/NonD family hydrolase [Acidobacteriota bacterium]
MSGRILRTGARNLRSIAVLTAVFAILTGVVPVFAQDAGDVQYTRYESMVEMRDGVKLFTRVFTPVDPSNKPAILMIRTPYGIGDLSPEQIKAALADLVPYEYIIVQQDIRGRFRSEGQFVMLRQPRDPGDGSAIDESTDTYDTIEWLLKNSDSNGRVGIAGTSYGAWLAVMAMLDPHPALKAVVPQASPADMWIGDDFHHNGAFRLSYGLEYTYRMETSNEMASPSEIVDTYDVYEWYLNLGPLSNVDKKYFHGKYPTWNDFRNHPDYDAFWKRQAFAPWLKRVTVPTLNVAGWWDQEDFYGPIKIYELLEEHDTKNQNFLVVGPWNHGGWSRRDGRKLGPIDFESDTSVYYRRNVQAKFLAHYLKGEADPDLPEALTFRTGVNEWQRHDAWPPRKNIANRELYFQQQRGLSFERPQAPDRTAYDSYVSDPDNPVPYRARPIKLGPGWSTWLVDDQRFASHRPDVVSWLTPPLEEDIIVSGQIVANIFASTTGTDSDWIFKLIDVYPEDYEADPELRGYQLMIAGEVFRGRYRESFEKPAPIPANEVQLYRIPFPANDHVFRKGHRIMVQVQSSWFPIIDRNPQTFVPNIFFAEESDFQKATQRIYRSARSASHIALPVEISTGTGR